MKTTRLCALIAVFFISIASMKATQPALTYTFVNPCQPFGIITQLPNTYGCYSYSATNAGAFSPGAYYTWDFGDGVTVVGTYVYHCYNTVSVATVYSVTVAYITPALCGVLPTQQTYTLLLNPPAQGSCVRNPPSYSLSASSLTVLTGFAIPEMMYSLNFGDGSPATNLITHHYNSCGNYIVEVKDWDMNFPQSICYSYTAINIACSSGTATGINEQTSESRESNVFPNPAIETLKITGRKLIHGIKIVDVTGAVCSTKIGISDFQTSADISELKPGIYLLKIEYEDGSGGNIKFIKE